METVTEKLCHKCKVVKPANEFGTNRATKTGLMCYCRPCTWKPPRTGTCIRCEESFPWAQGGKIPFLCAKCSATHKRCPTCGEVRPASDYGVNRAKSNGLNNYCKPCIESEEGRRIARRHNISTRWKITPDEYDAMIARGCDACGCQPGRRRLVIDHCHTFGYIRGVLCQACNSGLGKLGDNIEGLKRTIAYLERAEAKWRAPEPSG